MKLYNGQIADYYIPPTKAAMIVSLLDLGVKGATKLRTMGSRQLVAIYHKKRQAKGY